MRKWVGLLDVGGAQSCVQIFGGVTVHVVFAFGPAMHLAVSRPIATYRPGMPMAIHLINIMGNSN